MRELTPVLMKKSVWWDTVLRYIIKYTISTRRMLMCT